MNSFALPITLILVQLLTFILSLKHIFICLICNLLRSVNWNLFAILNAYNNHRYNNMSIIDIVWSAVGSIRSYVDFQNLSSEIHGIDWSIDIQERTILSRRDFGCIKLY